MTTAQDWVEKFNEWQLGGPLVECPECGWLAKEGDEDGYCQQHDVPPVHLGDKTGP